MNEWMNEDFITVFILRFFDFFNDISGLFGKIAYLIKRS